jgi:hypothetical protein
MATTDDLRKEPRHELQLSNALRVLTPNGDCMADLMDFSRRGIGIGFFDFFFVLDLHPGTVVKVQLLMDIDPQCVGRTGELDERLYLSGSEFLVEPEAEQYINEVAGLEEVDSNGFAEADNVQLPDPLVMDASVVWSYLNRLGLKFVNDPGDGLYEALLQLKAGQ